MIARHFKEETSLREVRWMRSRGAGGAFSDERLVRASLESLSAGLSVIVGHGKAAGGRHTAQVQRGYER